MHRRIDAALRHIRQDVDLRLSKSVITEACEQAGHVWRECVLTPFATLHWFLLQVLNGNTALTHVSLLAGRAFTAAAYCLARGRLPLAVFRAVLRGVIRALVPDTEQEGLWHGHRTFLIDGSSFSMPDTPELQKHFGQPGCQLPGCGFPVAKMLALFHAGTGLLLDVIATPLRAHEMAHVDGIHPTLKANDVLVGDRGFCSFAHLALLLRRGVHGVFRMHQRQIVDFTPNRPYCHPGDRKAVAGLPRSRWLRSLGIFDQVVEWLKPVERPSWMSEEQYQALPASIIVRELRYTVACPGFRTRSVTLVTTLLDPELYSAADLAKLYRTRWRVEQNLKHVKQTMKMGVLKCESVDGVLKELTVYALVYNLVCLVIGEAARRQGVDVERISFIDALRWLLDAKSGDTLPKLIVNPSRPDRFEPRVRKRRPKEYPVMKKPRRELRKQILAQAVPA
jgi:DDE family transposase